MGLMQDERQASKDHEVPAQEQVIHTTCNFCTTYNLLTSQVTAEQLLRTLQLQQQMRMKWRVTPTRSITSASALLCKLQPALPVLLLSRAIGLVLAYTDSCSLHLIVARVLACIASLCMEDHVTAFNY